MRYTLFMFKWLFYSSILLLGFLPVMDTDFGWHYRCGLDLLKHGEACIANNYSYFLANYQSYYSSFLYDSVLYLVFNWFGFLGVAILGSITTFLLIKVLLLLFKAEFQIKILLTYIFLFLSWNILSLGFRPQIVGLLLFATCLYLISLMQKQNIFSLNQKTLALLILLVIWANTHASIFIAVIMVGIFVLEQFIKKRFNFIWLLPLALLVTCINPFTYKIYIEAYHHWLMPMNQLIAEWVSPNNYLKILIILALTIYGYFLSKEKSFLNKHLFSFLLISLCGYLAFMAKRNIPMFILSFYYGFFQLKSISLNKLNIKSKELQLSINGLVICAIFFGILYVPSTFEFNLNQKTYCSKGILALPCEAINKLKNKTANIFTAYEWGGFLIWQLPKSKVFVDGRMPAWITKERKSPYTTYLEIIQAQKGWNNTLNKYHTDYLLIAKGTFLDLLLQKKAKKYNWKLIQRTNVYALFEKINN